MTDRPIIGITTYRQPADWSTWRGVPADLVPSDYSTSVVVGGGVPVLVPPLATVDEARAVVARLDGLIVSGGADLNPARYGAEVDPSVRVWYDDRDVSELLLLDAARDASLPTLGICRGMQAMAVHAGGTLIQHLPDVVGHPLHGGGDSEYAAVGVQVESGHRISQLIAPALIAPCHHHQAVATHPGFVATARDADGVLQAMESDGDRFEVAVQWHPETDADKGLFDGLVVAARERMHGLRTNAQA